MKYNQIEFSQEVYSKLCGKFGEDMKYILSDIAEHNNAYRKHKLTLEVIEDSYAIIYYVDKWGDREYIARRFEKFKDEMDSFRICHYIRCFQTGLNAAGIFPRFRVM
jgi:hypothetical protein